MNSAGPFLIAGMHRSGTSLLAHLLHKLGFDLGAELLSADDGNPDGYFEDRPAVAIHRRILHDAVGNGSPAWPDWGWSAGGCRDLRTACNAARPAALAYLKQRQVQAEGRGTPWGWKDPRQSLLLPFWLQLESQARLIAIYRQPWDVVSALQRVRPPLFLQHPDWCLPIWEQYNSALLEFITAHPDRCLLLNGQVLAADPQQLPRLLNQRWGLRCPPAELNAIVRPDRLSSLPSDDPLAQLQLAVFPEIRSLWMRLEQHADLPWKNCVNQPGSHGPEDAGPWPIQQRQEATLLIRMPSPQPRVAVVVPTYNQGDLLLEAIASVERQARLDPSLAIELQIVDDGSTDVRSQNILSRLQRLGLNVLHQANRGLPAARNTGIRATSAPLILPLDDDNLLLKGYVSPGIHLMETMPDLAVLYGNRKDFGLIEQVFRPQIKSPSDLYRMNRIDACALIRRTWLEACGGYDESLIALEDWDLWLSILRRGGKMGHLDQLCFAYRHRPNSMIRRLFADDEQHQLVLDGIRRKHG